MLNNELIRYTVALLTLCATSALLYPAAKTGASPLVWGLLGLAALAVGLSLATK